jgi:hypothetical protein
MNTETKQLKLKKLSDVRVPKAIKALDLIGGLAKYEPTPQQSAQILNALSEAYEIAVAKFQPKQSTQSKPSFALTV